MATNKLLLGIICLALFGRTAQPLRNFLNSNETGPIRNAPGYFGTKTLNKAGFNLLAVTPNKIMVVAKSQIGVREATGHNDGRQVEAYLHYTGNQKGAPWCASFVSWVYNQAGFRAPRTAWSPDLFPRGRLAPAPLPGFIFGIYFPELKRIAHCGIVTKQAGNWIGTIEGNTNDNGGREGDGVYRKLRHYKTIKCYADWLKGNGKAGAR